MNDAFVSQNFRGFAEIIANVRLRADPFDITSDSVGKINLRLVTDGTNSVRVAGEMPHLTRAKLAVHFRPDMDFKSKGKLLRDLANRRSPTAADVHWQSIELVRFRGEQVGVRDVFYE